MLRFLFILAAAGLITAVICLATRMVRTDDTVREIIDDWGHAFRFWLQQKWYGWRARHDKDVIGGPAAVPLPATGAPPSGPAPMPPPPTAPAGPPVTGPLPVAPPTAVAAIPGAAGSDLMYAVDALIATASSGDVRDVRRVVQTLAAANEGVGLSLRQLSQRLAEPDKDYGAEIWEPIGVAADQLVAGSMHLGQADASLVILLNATVGELAGSTMRAPHSSQLNGGSA